MVVAVPALAAIWWSRRRHDHRTRNERVMAGAAGVFLGIDVVVWQLAIDQIGAGLATLIVNSQAVIVPLVTWGLFREHPGRRALLAMPVVMAGLAMVTGLGTEGTYGDNPVLGVVLGVVAAAFYSGFLIVFRRSARSLAPAVGPLLDASVAAMLTIGAYGLASGGLDLTPSPATLGWLVLLGLGPQVVGWLAISHALPRLSAAVTSFAILLQPTLTLVWGRIIFGERAGAVQMAGVGVVLTGIAAVVTAGTRITSPR